MMRACARPLAAAALLAAVPAAAAVRAVPAGRAAPGALPLAAPTAPATAADIQAAPIPSLAVETPAPLENSVPALQAAPASVAEAVPAVEPHDGLSQALGQAGALAETAARPRAKPIGRDRAHAFLEAGVLGSSEHFEEWFAPATDFLGVASGRHLIGALAYHFDVEHDAYVIDLVEKSGVARGRAARGVARGLIAEVAGMAEAEGARVLLSPISAGVAQRYRELGFVPSADAPGFWELPPEAIAALRGGPPASRAVVSAEMVAEAEPADPTALATRLGRLLGGQPAPSEAAEAVAQAVRLAYGDDAEARDRALRRLAEGPFWDAVEDVYTDLLGRLPRR